VTRTKLLLAVVLTAVAALALGEGCAGDAGGSATCASACAALAACSGSLGSGGSECEASCQEDQLACSSGGGSLAFQGVLDCLAGLSCASGTSAQTMCGESIDELEQACPGASEPNPVPEPPSGFEAGFYDAGFEDGFYGGPEGGGFEASDFDIPPIEFDTGLPESAALEASRDAAGSDAERPE
jgi:hypothetical protein